MKKAALVLSGGGVLGVAHVGFLEKVWEDYEFDWYAGVSAGSIVAACLAMGKNPHDIWKIINDTKLFKIIFDISPSNFGLVSGSKVYEILEEVFGDARFEDLEKPLFIGATNFSTGNRVVISSGRIADAVRASISVPIVFDPYWHEEREEWLVDGGLSQNFPLDTAVEKYKGDLIIGIDVGSNIDPDIDFGEKKDFFKKPKYLTDSMVRMFRIFYKNQSQVTDSRIKIVTPDIAQYSAAEVLKIKEIYQAGEDSGLKFLVEAS